MVEEIDLILPPPPPLAHPSGKILMGSDAIWVIVQKSKGLPCHRGVPSCWRGVPCVLDSVLLRDLGAVRNWPGFPHIKRGTVGMCRLKLKVGSRKERDSLFLWLSAPHPTPCPHQLSLLPAHKLSLLSPGVGMSVAPALPPPGPSFQLHSPLVIVHCGF